VAQALQKIRVGVFIRKGHEIKCPEMVNLELRPCLHLHLRLHRSFQLNLFLKVQIPFLLQFVRLIRINHRMQACAPGVGAVAVVAVGERGAAAAEASGVQGAAIDKNPTYSYDRITGMVTGMVTFVIHRHHHRHLFRMSSAVPE
jgi:hypothetical protein